MGKRTTDPADRAVNLLALLEAAGTVQALPLPRAATTHTRAERVKLLRRRASKGFALFNPADRVLLDKPWREGERGRRRGPQKTPP